jgi:imidazolonepropionase-like amidohydrolase
MRLLAKLIGLLALLVPTAAAAEQIALVNARVIDGTGVPPHDNRTLILEDGRIAAMFESGSRPVPADARIIDLRGLTLMPGLIEGHVHFMLPDYRVPGVSADPAAIAKMRESGLRDLLRSGVTAVRELAGDARVARDLQRRQASGEIEAPAIRFAAVFFGPPFLEDPRARASASGLQPGTAPWSHVVDSDLDIPRAMREAKATGATGVKLYASLTADQLAQLSREARRQGLLVWIHSVVFPTGTLEAIAAGADTLVHAKGMVTIAGIDGMPANFNEGTRQWMVSRPFVQIDPDGPAFRAAYAAMASRGTILEPALIADGDRARQPLPPARAAMRDWACRATGAAYRAGVPIGAGTDSVKLEPFMLQRELERLVECGLAPLDAIRAATQTNARALGMGDTHGTVAVGKAADLIAVSGDPVNDIGATRNVKLVIQAGRVVVAPDQAATGS